MDVREIDALVAEHVFDERGKWEPCYSTSIFAAMHVVEKMREGGWLFVLGTVEAGFYEAIFRTRAADVHRAVAATAPFAICKAALSAKGVSTEQHNTDAIPGETEP